MDNTPARKRDFCSFQIRCAGENLPTATVTSSDGAALLFSCPASFCSRCPTLTKLLSQLGEAFVANRRSFLSQDRRDKTKKDAKKESRTPHGRAVGPPFDCFSRLTPAPKIGRWVSGQEDAPPPLPPPPTPLPIVLIGIQCTVNGVIQLRACRLR